MVGIRRLAVLLAAVPAPGWADAVVDTSLNVSTPVLIGQVRNVDLQQQDPVAEPRPEERLRDQAAHLDRFPVVATQPDRNRFHVVHPVASGAGQNSPNNGNIGKVEVYREAVALRFAMKHPAARKPLRRFVEILKRAEWPHFAALRETFASADYASGTVIFNIGGNKHRVLASVDFAEQVVVIDKVMTHEEYDRETF